MIVDDTCLYREALAGLLIQEANVAQVVCVPGLDGALQQIAQVDVVLLSAAPRDLQATVGALIRAAPTTPVIALAVPDSDADVIAFVEAGVAGLLQRREAYGDLLRLIGSVRRGETLCSPKLSATLLRRVATLAAERRESWSEAGHLTPREREVVHLLDEGMSNKEIARRLGIEVRTVKNHVHNLLQKLRVSRRAEAAAWMRAAKAGRPAPARSGTSPS